MLSIDEECMANELQGSCACCGTEQIIAYWDPELEHYLYLVDMADAANGFLCAKCEDLREGEIIAACN